MLNFNTGFIFLSEFFNKDAFSARYYVKNTDKQKRLPHTWQPLPIFPICSLYEMEIVLVLFSGTCFAFFGTWMFRMPFS